MRGYNCVMVYAPDGAHVLMCRRRKEPYKGLSNFPGGKIEPGEDGESAAYRELYEETGISRADIRLSHIMDFTYYYQDCYVQVYAGRLSHSVTLREEAHPLYWSDLYHDFFDMALYAGEGNIGHMLQQVEMYKEQILWGSSLDDGQEKP